MYMSFRRMQADLSRMQDAVALASYARDLLNERHGGNFGVTVNVGGDPTAVSLSSPWQSLGDYEKMRAAVAGDDQLQSLTRVAGTMITSVEDSIGQVLKPPGDRGNYAQVNTGMMELTRVGEAIGFAVEVAEFVDKKIGRNAGVVTSVTGNRSGIAWIGFADSMDQLGADQQALESDPDYLAFFGRSEGLFVPNSLEQSIWQFV